jgi:lysyl-tRNA synthetase class 2
VNVRATALAGVTTGGALVGLVGVAAAARPTELTVRAASTVGLYGLDRPRTALLGLGAVTLAHGLVRYRYLAWWAAAVLLVGWSLESLPGHPVRVGLLGIALAALVTSRHEFVGRPDRGRLRQLAWVGGGVLFVVTAVRLLPLGDYVVTVTLAGAITILIVALAPDPAPGPGSPAERALVRHMVQDAAADSLAPFATRLDRSYVFSPSGRSAIGYRVVLGTALAAGDPVGDPGEAGVAMAAFLERCRRQGWRPAVLGASEGTVPLWREFGLRGLSIGDEAVLDAAAFSLVSRRMRNVRQAVSRSLNAGVDVHIGPFPEGAESEFKDVLRDWLRGGKLRGFSMNLDQMLVPRPDVLIASARTSDGRLVAFARFLCCGGGRVLTLDIAPRRQDAPNGTIERLVVAAIEHARTRGGLEVSLNFAGLRVLFESDSGAARLGRMAARPLNRWVDIRRLYLFCAKFRPVWRSRSLLVGSWLSLAPVTTAALLAELRPSPTAPVDDAAVV